MKVILNKNDNVEMIYSTEKLEGLEHQISDDSETARTVEGLRRIMGRPEMEKATFGLVVQRTARGIIHRAEPVPPWRLTRYATILSQ